METPTVQRVIQDWEREFGEDRCRLIVDQPRRIVPPSNAFANPYYWWAMATITNNTDHGTDAGFVAGGVLSVLREHDSPTYFVGKDVVCALAQTDFGNAPMSKIEWAHDGILFMLPVCDELKYTGVTRVGEPAEDGTFTTVEATMHPIGVGIAKVWSSAEKEDGIAVFVVDNFGGCEWTMMPSRDTWQEAVDELTRRDAENRRLPRKPWQSNLVESEKASLLRNCELVFKILCLWNSVRTDGQSDIVKTGGHLIRKGSSHRSGKKASDLWAGLVVSLTKNGGECDTLEDGCGVRRHWRRGHFRQQVCGAGRLLRKSLWIRPHLVGAL